MRVEDWDAISPLEWAAVNQEIDAELARRRQSRTWLAGKAQMPRSNLTRRLDGEVAWDYIKLARITATFGMSVDELVRRARHNLEEHQHNRDYPA